MIRVVRLTDHKTIGLQYAVTALFFLLVGFLLMIVMRALLRQATTLRTDMDAVI